MEQQIIDLIFNELFEAEQSIRTASNFDYMKFYQGKYSALRGLIEKLSKDKNINAYLLPALETMKVRFGEVKAKELGVNNVR